VQYSIGHKPRGLLALTLVISAAMALLLITATASAEATETASSTTGLAQESVATVGAVAAPAAEPVDVPDPEEAPAPEEAPGADEGGGPATTVVSKEEPASAPVVKAVAHSLSSSPGSPSPSSGSPNRPQPKAAQAISRSLSSALPADPGNATPSTEPVSELTRKVHQDNVGTVARVVDRAAGTGPVQRLASDPLQMVSEAVHRAALDPLDLVIPDLEKLPLLGALAGVDPGPLAIDLGPLPPAVPGVQSMLPTDSHPVGQATALTDTLGNRLADLADVDLTSIEALSVAGPFVGLASRPSAHPAEAYLAQAGQQSRNFTPPNGNGPIPLPDAPQVGVSGSAASSFVPIAALLALLALAVPAIRRRPWEVPAFSAPAPFVCALERPG